MGRNGKAKPEEKAETIQETPLVAENDARDVEVTEAEVQNAVKKYAEQQGTAGKRALEATLVGRTVAFTNNTISVFIENEAQKLLFDDIKQDFLDAVRSMVKNNSLQLDIVESVEITVKKAYTSNEKFAAMAAKNPLLLELKKRLDLIVE